MAPNFDELRMSFTGGNIILPDEVHFQESLERWSATAVRPAAAIIRPKTAAEASKALRFAVANGIGLSVRGGGHSPSGESSARSPEDIILDLGLMRDVTVDAEAQVVTFGGGCTWADVDNALWKHGLATVGGTISHTGVGGLILGGGYGLLTGRYGMAVDLMISCEVVLASSEIVVASETENQDLFWALRGAGANFGVVTQFTSRAYPQGNYWGGVLVWPTIDVLDEVVAFINLFHQTTSGAEHCMVSFTADPATGAKMVVANVFYNGTTKEGEQFFEPLLKLQPCVVNTTAEVTYPVANTLADGIAKPMRRYMFGGGSFECPLDPQRVRSAVDEFYAGLDRPGNEDLRTSAFALEVIPQKKVMELGKSDVTSFNGRSGRYNVLMFMSWEKAESDAQAKVVGVNTTSVFKQKGQESDDGSAETYYNYLDPNVPAEKALMKSGRLFGSKLPRLRELKLKYDPDNVFKKNTNLMPGSAQ